MDLFCGAGGTSLGLHQAGMKVVLAVDSWKVALESHKLNLPDCETMEADILTLDPKTLPRVDYITGSPPCTEFSNANVGGDPYEGLILVKKFLEIVEEVKPRLGWCMENVPPILPYLNCRGLTNRVLDAADYGVPQHRKRAFVGRYAIPLPTHCERPQMTLSGERLLSWLTLRQALGLTVVGKREGEGQIVGVSTDSPSLTVRPISPHGGALRFGDMVTPKFDVATNGVMERRENAGFGDRIIDEDDSMHTITGINGGIRNDEWLLKMKDEFRRLTVEECQILQGFPIGYQFCGSKVNRYQQVGNAVPPPMARAIAEATMKNPPKEIEMNADRTVKKKPIMGTL